MESEDNGETRQALKSFHSVQLDADLCVGCTTCIKFCPTKAIRVRNRKAKIFEDRCIDCGECIRRCPKGAKKAVSDHLFILDAFDIKVALPAPSLYAQFGLQYIQRDIFHALHQIGFDEVFDVAWGALIATNLTRRILVSTELKPRISSACPVVVRLIQQRFPSLLPNLIPLLPPSEIAAIEAKKRLEGAPGKIGIFFLSPCTAKVTSVRSPLGYSRSAIDAVISFGDIFPALKRALDSPSPSESSDLRAHRRLLPLISNLEPGIGWARSDGELDALKIENAVSVDGISNVIELLEAVENRKVGSIDYIEALACPGGCVGGPMAVENPHIARATMRQKYQNTAQAEEKIAAFDAERNTGPDVHPQPPEHVARLSPSECEWTHAIAPNPVLVLDADLSKALEMAENIEKIRAQLPGIDCGACGAPDCDAFAEDIVRGQSSLDECQLMHQEPSDKRK